MLFENYKNKIEKVNFKEFESKYREDNTTLNIIKKLQSKDDRIKLINHSKNFGVYRSRIDAILLSKGKFLILMDPDESNSRHKSQALAPLWLFFYTIFVEKFPFFEKEQIIFFLHYCNRTKFGSVRCERTKRVLVLVFFLLDYVFFIIFRIVIFLCGMST